MYYEEQQRDRLGLLQYQDLILDNLSRVIVNSCWIEENFSFLEQIIFKTYEKYYSCKTEVYSINQILNLLEIFLDALIKFKPSSELPEDKISIN